MSKKLIRPTDIEETQINAAALADPDNLPLTDNELQQFRRAPGRPQGSGTKEQVTLRIDANPGTIQSHRQRLANSHQ